MSKLTPYYGLIEKNVESNTTDNNIPFSAQINILNKCYQRCIGCRKPEWPDVKLPKDTVIKIIDWLSNVRKAHSVVFSGGDPPAHTEFIEMLEYAKKSGLETGTLTACLWGKQFDVEKFVINSNWISISIDGADEEIYTKTRGVNTLELVKENIKLLNVYKEKFNKYLRIRCNSTISNVNIHQIPDIMKLCADLSIECFFFPIHTWEDLKIQSISREQVKSYVEAGLNCVSITKIPTNLREFIHLLDRQQPPVCIMPWTHCFIDADGSILHCCRLAEDNNVYFGEKRVIIGNVLKDDIDSIYKSEKAKDLMQKTYKAKYKVCQQCDRYNAINWDFYAWQNSKERIFL